LANEQEENKLSNMPIVQTPIVAKSGAMIHGLLFLDHNETREASINMPVLWPLPNLQIMATFVFHLK
jgi:hypothetical protein